MSAGSVPQQIPISHCVDRIVSVHHEQLFPSAEYLLLEELGGGAFGTTYLVKKRNLSTPGVAPTQCVAKFMEEDLYSREMAETTFQQEVSCMRRLRHFACVEFLEAFVQAEGSKHFAKTPVLIMEYVDGGNLQKLRESLTSEAFLTPSFIENTFVQLLLGLHHIHSRHMLHRDLKPSNCVFTASGLVKICDYWLSKVYDPLTPLDAPAMTYCGTRNYLAPERCRRLHYGRPADVWALAIVVYEVMELQMPFASFDHRERTELEFADKELSKPPLPSRYPPPTYLKELLPRLLLPNAKERPSTRELLADPQVLAMVDKFQHFVATNEGIAAPVKAEIKRSIAEALTPVLTEDLDGWVHMWSMTNRNWTPKYLHVGRNTFEFLDTPTSARDRGSKQLSTVARVESNWQVTCFLLVLENGTHYQLHSHEANWWIKQLSMRLEALTTPRHNPL